MDYIDTIPDEILVRFFDAHTTLKELWNCAFVSKRWFALAKEHPTFWSSAEFGMRHKVPVFLERLNRRPGLPIKIRARATRREDHVVGYKAIEDNIHRITDLDIYTWNEDWVLHSLDLNVPAPLLETLRVEVARPNNRHDEITPSPRTLFQGSAPHLTSIVLLHTTFIFAVPESLCLPSVLSVSITHRNAYDIPWDDLPVDDEPDEDAPWLLPFDLLDRVASAFPRMQSLALDIRSHFTPARNLEWQLFRHYPATPPSDRTLLVLRALKELEASWCAAAWSVLQHFDLQSLAGLRLWTDHGDDGVAAACAPSRPYAALVGVSVEREDFGVIDLASGDGAFKRTILARPGECWNPLFLGALLASQVSHLTALSVVFLAWQRFLACGLHSLPARQTLRVELPQHRFGECMRDAPAEDGTPIDCPSLRVIMVEADAPYTSTEDFLESFIADLDAPMDRVTLALRQIAVKPVLPSFGRTQFARVVVDDAPVDAHEDWLARADSYCTPLSADPPAAVGQ